MYPCLLCAHLSSVIEPVNNKHFKYLICTGKALCCMWIKLSALNFISELCIYLVKLSEVNDIYFMCSFMHIFFSRSQIALWMKNCRWVLFCKSKPTQTPFKTVHVVYLLHKQLRTFILRWVVTAVKLFGHLCICCVCCFVAAKVIWSKVHRVDHLWKSICEWFTARVYMSEQLRQGCVKKD